MTPDEFIDELWGYAAEVPTEQHPWFDGIIKHRWSREQIILGEVQHYLRVRTNPIFFGYMAVNAVSAKAYAVMNTVLENFMEELGGKRTHVDIMLQFLEEGGICAGRSRQCRAGAGNLGRDRNDHRLLPAPFCARRRRHARLCRKPTRRRRQNIRKGLPRAYGPLRFLGARSGNLPTSCRRRRRPWQPTDRCDSPVSNRRNNTKQSPRRSEARINRIHAGVGRPRAGDDGKKRILEWCIRFKASPTKSASDQGACLANQ